MSARKFISSKSVGPSSWPVRLTLRPVCHAIAMMLATGAAMNAHAGMNLANIGAQISATRGAGGAGMANLGVGVSPQVALQASQPSIQNLAHAAQGIAQQIAAQQAAAANGLNAASNVPNGLAPGGLQVAPGITFVQQTVGGQPVQVSQNTNTNNPLLWVNAYGPQQTVNPNGTVTVNVQQTAQDAVLTWQTMNVGRQTTLNFNQSAGTQTSGANNWIVLNRIMDPSGAPSQILGSITAQGTVLVINRNGILFGAGSQINVHSLLASSLDLLNTNDDIVQSSTDIAASNQLFLQTGLAVLDAGTSTTTNGNSNTPPAELLGLGNNVSVASASDYQAPGNITIAAGASITTSADGSASNGGFVLIAAPNVSNAGNITVAPTGQVMLAAGVGVSLQPQGNPQLLVPELTGRVTVGTGSGAVDITPVGTLTNTGLVQADRGNITLLGSNVAQNGVIGVTTSVNTPGTITISTVDEGIATVPTGGVPGPNGQQMSGYLQTGQTMPPSGATQQPTMRAGDLTFGDGSVTTVLPDDDGETATASGTTFTAGTIKMTAGSVWFQSGSLIEAPGSTVQVAALTPSAAGDATPPGDTLVQGRIYVDNGATIDVSGLANVELPISDILLTIGTITENELADSPLLRDSFLNGQKNVVVDSTLTGTDADGLQWVGTPILNLSGDVSLMPQTIDQLLTSGGTITLSGNEVMTADGSLLNLNGGYIHYLGGMVDTTRLVDANGAIVPIGAASPYDTYVGIAGEFVESHPRWGVTTDWFNPLLSGGAYEGDYIVGGNAGTLNVFASQDMVLDGTITAEAFGGSKQVQGNDQPVGGTFNLGAIPGSALDASLAGLTQGSETSTTGESGTVILQDSAPQLTTLAPDFSATTLVDTTALNALSATDPDNVLATTVVPVNTLNNGGFANVNITGNATGSGSIVVAAGTQLAVQPGGSIRLNSQSGNVTVLGNLIAPSGTISVSSQGIVVGPDSTISVAGQWVNNDTQTTSGTVPGDSEYINGGSIAFSTMLNSATVDGNAQDVADTSGSIILQPGSLIDVSSGGEIQANGQMLMQNGIAEGTAGSLSLETYSDNVGASYGKSGHPTLPSSQPTAGQIELGGTIDSFGFSGGGTLTLQAPGFQIGGDPSQAPSWDLYLPANFFAQQGFGKYVLNALYDTTVAPGTTVYVTQQNLIPDVPALQHAVSGSDIGADGLTALGTLDAYHRQATDLVLTAGAYLLWEVSASDVQPPSYADAGVTGAVTVSAGASIIGDAGASIGLGSPAQVTVLGSIVAPGGAITLSADATTSAFVLPGQGQVDYTSPTQSVWLGADAVLDVAGVALTNPLAAPVKDGLQTVIPDTGKVLPGGSVTISDDAGYVVAQAGSVIDVSGTSASFDELQANGGYVPQQVWSNAGSITLAAANGLLFDGTLQAQPGAAQAQGGTLTILPEQVATGPATMLNGTNPGAQILILQQSGDFVPAGLTQGQSIVAAVGGANGDPTGVLNFAADRLSGSGISTLVIGSPTLGGNVTGPVPVAFAGNVDLAVPGEIEINASQIVALSSTEANDLEKGAPDPSTGSPYTLAALLTAQDTTPASTGTNVTLAAPYVALAGLTILDAGVSAFTPVEALGDGTLTVDASFIDLVNQLELSNFAQANFISSGDIRLSSTNLVMTGSVNALVPGELFTPGNLSFQAADLYPSTGNTFILDAVGPSVAGGTPAPTTITFAGNGASGVPLSAGGTLLVDATDIVQGGTVRAPSGSLIFGVGDTTDATTQAQFNKLPLVATDSVSLTDGSVTSVSLDGAIIPYGTTVDGVEWQFNPNPGANPAPDLSAPPAKFVSVNGSSVSLDAGATIDLSGGGDLQAEEWVPGTGGTRDVLSQYNVSYATTASGVAIPTNIGAANIYAIVPGPQSPVSAYDPVLAQTTQPSTNANGTVSTVTDSIGVGSASLGGAVGASVYLSGVPGLAAGYYTLLPAKYATLPGAYRVTVSTDSGTIRPGSSQVLPDGTVAVAGYMGNALTGSQSATPTLFDVQSGAVWQQYSQYTLTSANAFFPPLAATAGDVTPPLPMDAGQLVLAATQGLTLGATLKTAAAPGGAPAEVDIASQAIQIVGSGAGAQAALPGYLQISADQLDALDAGSLLIGGTRTQTSTGTTINPIATSVVLSNDAANPLTGPEVILVSANSVQVDAGSVIAAQGAYPAAKDQSITISANATTGTSDGALLSVSNGGDSIVTRSGTANGTGLLTVAAGATLSGGQALTLDSSGNLTFNPAASLSGNVIAVDGSAITFTDQSGAGAAALPGFVVGPTQIAQLANANEVILRSAGAMTFDGTTDLTFGNAVDLSAGTFQGDGGSATINAPQVTLDNELGAPDATASTGTGSLTVNAGQISFGNGSATVSGFGSVTMNASGGIVAQGNGTLDLGAVPVTLNAPVYLAATGSGSTIQTTGVLNLNSAAGTALTQVALGGAFTFIGGTLNDNGATIEAPAGNVSMEATSGDLTISSGSTVSSAGVALPFFDITEYAPAGSITLTVDTGSINIAAGSTLDFSGANGGGAAGSLSLSAPDQTVNLAGTINGNAASGFLGGSFSLNTGGAVDLDSLASELASGGVNDAITVQTHAGNLTLSAGNTLTAHVVSLTADGGAGGQDPNNGNVQIDGTINAAGNAGGEIDLYGKSGVDLEGSLIATGSSATEQGGTVNIGTSAVFDPNAIDPATGVANPYNATYGYENVYAQNSGAIVLGSGALIDVSGGTAGGLSDGTVNIRAPLLADGSVNLTIEPFEPNKGIVGSRATTLEAYAVWSTTDATTGNQHFDGIVDPAGWYQVAGPNSTPQLVAGTFTDQSGNSITYTPGTYDAANGTWTTATLSNDPGASWKQIQADLALDLENDYFVPETGDANTAHQQFYGYGSTTTNGDGSVTTTPGTLMGFVQTFQVAATPANGLGNLANANLMLAPGIELDNPGAAINNGNISILTNWNRGSGSSPSDLDFRTVAGVAPIITLRAENNVEVKASLTDGFFQIANPVNPGTSINVPSSALFGTYGQDQSLLTNPSGHYGVAYGYGLQYWVNNGFILAPPTNLTGGTAGEVPEYYALWAAYAEYLTSPIPHPASAGEDWVEEIHQAMFALPQAGEPVAPTPPSMALQATDPSQYLIYLAEYEAYANNVITSQAQITPPAAPMVEPVAVITASSVSTPAVTDNSPSPVAVAGNSLPLLSASLTGGNSSTFNVVAGANLSSANPLALQAAALFPSSAANPAGGGSVILSGNFAYNNASNPNLPNDLVLLAPTMIRTGTGSINVAAANDVWLFDPTDTPTSLLGQTAPLLMSAPGVIYTAGAPAQGAPAGSTATIINGSSGSPDILVSSTVSPDAAGNVSIVAQNNITGLENVIDPTGAITGFAGNSISQFWWQWMEVGNPTVPVGATTQTSQTSIDFGEFDQGVMSVGGNVKVFAGGNISDLAVSLPTTWYLGSNGTQVTVGGGNLNVTAGGNILSGDYFVANGTGTLIAGGRIGSDVSAINPFEQLTPVSTLLATQAGTLDVSARQGVDIGGVFDPSLIQSDTLTNTYKQPAPAAQGYSADSALSVESTTGDIDLETLGVQSYIDGNAANTVSLELPATLNLTAFTGGITIASGATLAQSPTSNLNLIANQSINLNTQDGGTTLGMSSEVPSSIDETDPVRIYSLTGSIIDGVLQPASSTGSPGFYTDLLNVTVDKPAFIEAGKDIVNLSFDGQNLIDDDVTRIIAGRDIDDTPLAPNVNVVTIPVLQLGGPGYFDIEAGRNIGPLTSQAQAFDSLGVGGYPITGVTTGIDAVGNANNPALPHESASVEVLFGIGPGIDDANFISAYINPASTLVSSSIEDLGGTGTAFMEQYDEGQLFDTGLTVNKPVVTLTGAQAWAQFQALPSYVQQLFVEQVFFQVLTDVGKDYNNPASPYFQQYARGFTAINTLFPASLGYTANNLGGGSNGANALVDTGNLDIRNSTIQTQQGGNVSILGPGGEALIGSSSAPPAIVNGNRVIAGPGTQGILTLEQGNINIFTDQSLLLAQSRVFTEQGGNITIWSSNGNINAGEGATSVADVPAPEYVCDVNHFCTLDAKGEVTGAGIGTLQTIPDAPTGNANLLAPRGTVDAGAAGIRVSGDLNVAALQVLNAANIQVQGKSTGVPTVAAVDTGALTAASAATSAVTQIAQNLVRNNAGGVQQRHWIITVQVEGFGDANDDNSNDGNDNRKKRRPGQVSYNPSSEVSIVGYGKVGDTQRAYLTKDEIGKLGGI
jgi:filamentous hemagglutinin family protein